MIPYTPGGYVILWLTVCVLRKLIHIHIHTVPLILWPPSPLTMLFHFLAMLCLLRTMLYLSLAMLCIPLLPHYCNDVPMSDHEDHVISTHVSYVYTSPSHTTLFPNFLYVLIIESYPQVSLFTSTFSSSIS